MNTFCHCRSASSVRDFGLLNYGGNLYTYFFPTQILFSLCYFVKSAGECPAIPCLAVVIVFKTVSGKVL